MYASWRSASIDDPGAATDALRVARDAMFREHPQSPIPATERARFGGLSYWAYDPGYRMTATIEDQPEPTAPDLPPSPLTGIALPSSGAEIFTFRKIGLVRLSGPLAGSSLPVFWMEGYAGGLFLPFRDATSGSETYAAGRYLLDTVKGADLGGSYESGELVLDFNLAFHPSCAYDPIWSCPLAPPESRLDCRRPGRRAAPLMRASNIVG